MIKKLKQECQNVLFNHMPSKIYSIMMPWTYMSETLEKQEYKVPWTYKSEVLEKHEYKVPNSLNRKTKNTNYSYILPIIIIIITIIKIIIIIYDNYYNNASVVSTQIFNIDKKINDLMKSMNNQNHKA